jgi:uncharacterized membrane protein
MENIGDVDWGIVARIVHVLAVVVWVGGVWFVTVLPAMSKKPSQEWRQRRRHQARSHRACRHAYRW